MPNKFARQSGDFYGPIWALTNNGVPGSTTPPDINDTASANTFFITISSDVTCGFITAGTPYGGLEGGMYLINTSSNPVNLNIHINLARNTINNTTVYPTLSAFGTNTLNLSVGRFTVSSSFYSRVILSRLTGTLNFSGNLITGGVHTYLHVDTKNIVNIYGNVRQVNTGEGSSDAGSSLTVGAGALVNIYGDVGQFNFTGGSTYGATGSPHITISENSTLNVYGNVYGEAHGGILVNEGLVRVYGNVYGGQIGAGISTNNTQGVIEVYGDVYGGAFGFSDLPGSGAFLKKCTGISGGSQSDPSNIRVFGNLIGSSIGIPAILAPGYQHYPSPGVTPPVFGKYISHPYMYPDTPVYNFTTNSFSSFSVPPVSSVRLGVNYSTGTGTCHIPAPSAVAYGTLYDSNESKFGLAINRDNVIFNTLINNLSVVNSLGDRVKKSATNESTGHLVASFSN